MKFNYRKSPRAQWHGYMGANYFVTICTKGKDLLDSLTDLFCGECNWFIHRFTPPLTSL